MFLNEPYLLLLALIPMLSFVSLMSVARRRRAMRRLGDSAMILSLTNRTSALLNAIRGALWLIAFAMIALAMARPVWGEDEETTTLRGVSIVIVLDISASMDVEDVLPSRLKRARLTIRDLLSNLDTNNEVSFVLFAGVPFLYLPLTTDIRTAELFLERIDTSMVPTAGTNIGNAIDLSLSVFPDESDDGRLIFLLSDGEYHGAEFAEQAERAGAANAPIYAIGYGTAEGGPIPDTNSPTGFKLNADGERATSRLDETSMQQITEISGGSYQRADIAGREVAILLEQIRTASTRPIGDIEAVRGLEQYSWFALIAFVCLVGSWLLPEGRRK